MKIDFNENSSSSFVVFKIVDTGICLSSWDFLSSVVLAI